MEPAPNTGEPQPAELPDDSDRPRIKTQLYKTEPCQNWTLYGTCGYGRMCKFAHGPCEQRSRPRHPKYRTSMCTDFPLGTCAFGNRCNFAHTPEELRSPNPAAAVATSVAHTSANNRLSASANNRPSVGTNKKQTAGASSSRVPAITRDIRRYQSMGTLRSARPPISNNTLPTPPVPALPAHDSGMPGQHPSSAGAGAPAAYQVYAHSSSDHLGIAHTQHHSDMAMPPLHYLQHEQVARRVSSLSQLPNLRTSSPFPSPSPSLSYYASPLAQITPVGAVSPAVSSSSYWESDDASALPLLADGSLLASEYQRVQRQQTQSYFAPALASSSNAAFSAQHQRRTLTSSVSMQTLPRLQLSASREQHQNSPRSDNLLLSSSFPMVKSIGSSQGSAATLIDSDLWSSTAQFKSFGLEQQPAKPFDMRSFPLSSSGPAPTLEAAGTACLGFTGGVDPLGIYCNGAYIPCDRQQQLRRQHSTGDWLSLRSAAHQQAPVAHTLLPSFADSRLLLEPFDDCGLYTMVDNRPDSLETASAIDSGMARDADPFGVYHKGAFIPSSHHQQQLRRQHSTDDWISLRGTAHRQAPATLKLLPSSVNPRSLLESSDDRGMYAMMDGRFNSLEHLRSATSTRKQLGTHSIKGI